MKIFIDTSALAALENKKDIHHKESITFRDEIKNRRYKLYTSNFILDETYTLLLANVGYEKTVEFAKRIKILRDNGLLHVVQATGDIEDSAWFIFERFNKDKFWSFTDCTSKAIMELLDINEAFSFDSNLVETPQGSHWTQDKLFPTQFKDNLSGKARLGEGEVGIGETFRILTIATREDLPIGLLERIPPDAIYSNTVNVRRVK